MNLLQSVAGVFLAISLLGCATATGGGPLLIRSLAKGAFSGIQEARQEVVKDRAAWEKIWAQHNANTTRAVPLPEVNFSKEMVVVATMGTKRTGGYSVEIVRAEPRGKKLRIGVQQTSPPPGAMTIQALTAPFHFVAVPRRDLELEFIEAAPAARK
jgi:hypothetical protein